ncbi:MAG: histidine kinase [Rhodobacteraceae bacterium]|uniref:sensor histidine kinase n=1 Tax=Salipiger TaxID=263377 RepID=UPI0008F0969A|nr:MULTISPECIES: histidine kinase dimerization/phosphoacceptor domain -containing protein [Salipiger]MAB08627.1 histidine kinase [Paracoccaceae bacterium]MBN9885739.1 DUF4118 domain-containing protein [Salipiger abyssi]GGA25270.1 hypothetical protein GCM10011326_41910 [Salipiger profundus]SFD77992.1 Two-component sensor histidine kinase, contains HisKA and HATPase domains [Salipiger profundus]
MKRLAKYDFVSEFQPGPSRLGAQLLFGAAFAVGMIGLRSALDVVVPTAGPFALVYPTVLLATLYGHWQAGIAAFGLSFLWAWFFVLPTAHSFYFEVSTDPARVAINASAALIVLVFADTFRRAVQSAIGERDKEIERRNVLLQELDHRTKNNFALAVSLLQQQKRGEGHESHRQSLDQAIGRLHSFAQAYANLAETQGEGAVVAMQPYLNDIVSKSGQALFGDNISVVVETEEYELPREVAVAIGLFANEALTNCAKYAFPEGRAGTVTVRFEGNGHGWLLEIADDGVGSAETIPVASTGIGTKLMKAFAVQACGRYELEVTNEGRLVRLTNRS